MIDRILEGARVVVCLGPGGVGKTTTAAALAIAGARRGRRVAVLTVDPAARLKDALALPDRPGEFHRVPLPDDVSGSLDAILLDAKGLFDELVRRLAPNDRLAERVLENPVYRNVAGAFAGSDAYMALEQLLDVVANPDFDLIVVDTPPASHALELFDAPDRILALLNSRALEYLSEPIRILGVATSRLTKGILSAVLGTLERMTGLTLLRDISELASDFASVSPAFRERAEAIHSLMRDETTRYVLMAAADPHASRDTVQFAADVSDFGIHVDAVVVNRVLRLVEATPSIGSGFGAESGAAPAVRWPPSLARNLVTSARDLAAVQKAQRDVIEALHAGIVAVQADGQEDADADGLAPLWIELPALSPAPTTLDGIDELAQSFAAPRQAARQVQG